MPRQIQQIRVPRNVVSELPTPVTTQPPVTSGIKPPVVNGISPPVVDVPGVVIEYPTLDVPTEEQFQGDMSPQNPPQEPPSTPNRPGLQNTPSITPEVPQPSIEVGGVDIPLPDPGPLVAAGSLAVVTTVVTLGATIGVNQAKTALEPFLKRLLQPKKKKIKIKQVKPVLHFVPNEDGTTEVIQYSQKGMKVLEGGIKNLEQYLRDQVDIDSLWEYDNKIIIDEELKNQLTKEGNRRFKKYFASPKVIAKKLGAKFSF